MQVAGTTRSLGGQARPAIERAPSALVRLRPYAFPVAMTVYFPLILAIDASGTSAATQHAIGVLTFGILAFATWRSPAAERRLIWIAVALWTCVELFASLSWGIYEYRLGNVPLFVPPGHGLIYLTGLRLSRSPLIAHHAAVFCRSVVAIGAAWAVAGLVVLPIVTGRVDFAGATLWPALSICVLASRMGSFYASVFVAASLLEIVGTSLGVWTWSPLQPVTGFPSGNPPSVVAAAYGLFDLLMLRATVHVLGRGRFRMFGSTSPA